MEPFRRDARFGPFSHGFHHGTGHFWTDQPYFCLNCLLKLIQSCRIFTVNSPLQLYPQEKIKWERSGDLAGRSMSPNLEITCPEKRLPRTVMFSLVFFFSSKDGYQSTQFPNYRRYLSQILIAQIEDLNEDCVEISRPYILHFPRNKVSKIVTVGLSRVGLVHRFKGAI